MRGHLLYRSRLDTQDNDKRREHQRGSHERNQRDAGSTRRELAEPHVMLALEVAVEADDQRQDADSQKRGAHGLADVPYLGHVRAGVWILDGLVEAEQLRDGDADARKGQRRP